MKKAVQFGAGNIGRGFLGELFSKSGYEIIFVEVNPEIIRQLNQRGEYLLRIVGDNPHDITVKNVSAVDAKDTGKVAETISSADIAATAVGANVLGKIAPLIAAGITARADKNIAEPFNIIICENLLGAGVYLKEKIREILPPGCRDYMEKHTGFVETVVSRMIPIVPEKNRKEDPLFIMAEEYGILPASKKGFVGAIPLIKGLLPQDNIAAYEERKLFIHNLGHAVCAYNGFMKGHTFIWETVMDKDIRSLLEMSLEESSRALIKKHGFTGTEMTEHAQDLIKRFGSRALGDTVLRVGRDPVRKLGPNDRLIGSARNCLACGVEPVHIVRTIAAALKFSDERDAQSLELQETLRDKGIDYVLENICGLSENDINLKTMIKTELGRRSPG